MKVIIIGAGIGGMAAAARLAHAGCEVVVLEKNEQVGGKMGQLKKDGFRWDTGPSVITMKHVFEELWRDLGRAFPPPYLSLIPIDPLTKYFFPNGNIISATLNKTKMHAQIAEIYEDDIAGYEKLLAQAKELHDITGPVFIYDKPPTLKSFLRVPMRDWLKVNAWQTMQSAINKAVVSPEMRQLFGRFATYVGGDPYQAPATLNVIAHVEMNEGVYYPQGGIYALAQGFRRLAEEVGVRFETDSKVAEINVVGRKVSGVTLKDGLFISCDAVVSNVDVTTTYKTLLADEKKLGRDHPPSCSGFVLLLGIQGQHPHLAHHNIWFSDNYPAEFKAIFQDGQPPDTPTIYATITSKTDPSHAPAGHENWFILVNAPALGDSRYDWHTNRTHYRNQVLAQLQRFGIDLNPLIRSETIFTPLEIRQMTGAWRGALYGASPNNMMAAFKRPHNRSKIKGLYFAGGTTHPGGGVPMVTLSGKVAAECVLEDFG